MGKTSDVKRRAQKAVANVLPQSAQVSTSDASHLTVNGIPLHVKWIGEGWLRDVRSALEDGRELPDILVARQMSPGAREAISAAELNWVDETGAAEIAVDSIIVSRSGRSTQTSRDWTPSVIAVAEALLCETKATVKATREATGLSTGSCVNALSLLQDLGLLRSDAARGRDAGREITDPDRLLDAYASEVAAESSPKSLEIGVTWRDPVKGITEVGEKWNQSDTLWACTGVVAASVIAPHLSSGTAAELYIDADTVAGLESVASDAGLRPLEGGRLRLLSFPSSTTRRLVTEVDQLRIAPWPRVYADLRTTGVRGEEAAEHLREVVRGR